MLIGSSHFSTEPHPLHSILCTAGFDTCLSLSLLLPLYCLCLIFVVSFLKSGLTSPLVLHVSFLIHSSCLVPCLLCSCSDRLLSLLHSSIIPAWPAFVIPSFLLQSSFGSPFDLPSYPHYSCFLPRCRLFSLFLPSGDAAKRKAWKLNRVSSLRIIYTNSLQNSEGKKKKTAVVGRTDPQLTSTLTLPPLQGWSPLCWRFVLLIPGMNELVICRKRWWNWVWVIYMFKQEALRHLYNMKANSLMNHQLRSKREN